MIEAGRGGGVGDHRRRTSWMVTILRVSFLYPLLAAVLAPSQNKKTLEAVRIWLMK